MDKDAFGRLPNHVRFTLMSRHLAVTEEHKNDQEDSLMLSLTFHQVALIVAACLVATEVLPEWDVYVGKLFEKLIDVGSYQEFFPSDRVEDPSDEGL